MLKTTNRCFRPIKKENIFLILKWRNEQLDVLRQKKRITCMEQVRWFDGLKKDRNQKLFAIFEKAGPRDNFIGYCGLTHIDYLNRRAEISFLVDTNRTKIGSLYMMDMLSALSFLAGYAFLKLRLKRIFTETYEFRKKHIKILEEFGLKKEGVLHSHVFLKGKYYNSLMHYMLREEYANKQKRR